MADVSTTPDGTEMLRVVIAVDFTPARPELGGRKALLAARRRQFDQISAPVKDLILKLGGSVTGEAYLSGSLRATVPRSGLDELIRAPRVESIEFPRPLHREPGRVTRS